MLLFLLIGAASPAASIGASSLPPVPQQEKIPASEAADTAALIETFTGLIRHEYQSGVRPAPRDAHPKAQGCVRGSFTVRSGLSSKFGYAVFASAKTYPTWIRFSNGNPQKQPDGIGDGRGMAIKVIGVTGPKLVPDEPSSQDFVMINFPVFFSANAHDYLEFGQALVGNTIPAFVKKHPRDAQIAHDTSSRVTRDMFAQTYFSMSPYTIGKRYMKFRTVPVRCQGGPALPDYPGALQTDPNFLRTRMALDLGAGSVCFQLQIQLQTDAATQPIENTTVEWNESQAPFVAVADIVIPKQTFTSDAQQTFCENLSYTPWHGSVDLRPVGGINRIRLAVYNASNALRHSLNKAPFVVPTGYEHFK